VSGEGEVPERPEERGEQGQAVAEGEAGRHGPASRRQVTRTRAAWPAGRGRRARRRARERDAGEATARISPKVKTVPPRAARAFGTDELEQEEREAHDSAGGEDEEARAEGRGRPPAPPRPARGGRGTASGEPLRARATARFSAHAARASPVARRSKP